MKLYLPILSFCVGSLAFPAVTSARTMIVTPVSSEPVKIEVSTATHITFSKDLSKMIVSSGNSGESESFDINDIANIVFTIDSAVNGVLSELNDLQFSNNGGIVTISGADTIRYAVWNINGNQIMAGEEEQTVTLDFTARTAGIYIIKANNRTVKFINR